MTDQMNTFVFFSRNDTEEVNRIFCNKNNIHLREYGVYCTNTHTQSHRHSQYWLAATKVPLSFLSNDLACLSIALLLYLYPCIVVSKYISKCDKFYKMIII